MSNHDPESRAELREKVAELEADKLFLLLHLGKLLSYVDGPPVDVVRQLVKERLNVTFDEVDDPS